MELPTAFEESANGLNDPSRAGCLRPPDPPGVRSSPFGSARSLLVTTITGCRFRGKTARGITKTWANGHYEGLTLD